MDDDPGNVERARSQGLKALLFLNEDQCLNDLEALLGHPITDGWGTEKKQKTLFRIAELLMTGSNGKQRSNLTGNLRMTLTN